MTSPDLLRALAEARDQLLAEAECNRAWANGRIDGRYGDKISGLAALALAQAEQRERWAGAIAEAAARIKAKP